MGVFVFKQLFIDFFTVFLYYSYTALEGLILMKIAIFDDEQFYLENTEKIIRSSCTAVNAEIFTFNTSKNFSVNTVGTAAYFDIIILDIKMPEIDGITLAEYIRQRNSRVRIIYLTNYIEYATEVYNTEHTFYVLKDNAEDRLPIAINKAAEQLKSIENDIIYIKGLKDGIIRIRVDDILYIERHQRESVICTVSSNEATYENIEDIVAKIKPDIMARCHRSFCVNMRHIKKLSGSEILLDNSETLKLSRNYTKKFKEDFMRFIKSEQRQ